MTAPEDHSPSRAEQVVEVYESPEEHEERDYTGRSRWALALAGAAAMSHAAALLGGHYVLALVILLAAIAGVGLVVADEVSLPRRSEPR